MASAVLELLNIAIQWGQAKWVREGRSGVTTFTLSVQYESIGMSY